MSLIDQILNLFGLQRKQQTPQSTEAISSEAETIRQLKQARADKFDLQWEQGVTALSEIRFAMHERLTATHKSIAEKIRAGKESEFTKEERELYSELLKDMVSEKTSESDTFKQAFRDALERHEKEKGNKEDQEKPESDKDKESYR
jgi:hypothetical protein